VLLRQRAAGVALSYRGGAELSNGIRPALLPTGVNYFGSSALVVKARLGPQGIGVD